MVVEQAGTLQAACARFRQSANLKKAARRVAENCTGTFATFPVSENTRISLLKRGRPMTLFDAPAHRPSRSFRSKKLLVSVFVLCGVAVIAVFLCWNVPAEHRVNRFFSAVEANDFPLEHFHFHSAQVRVAKCVFS
jgi:hypothetical protein